MKVQTRNVQKLVFATKKAANNGVQLMADGDLVYSLTTSKTAMYYPDRRNRLEASRLKYLDLGLFQQEPEESLYDLFLRIWEEAVAGGCALPAHPPSQDFVNNFKWRRS